LDQSVFPHASAEEIASSELEHDNMTQLCGAQDVDHISSIAASPLFTVAYMMLQENLVHINQWFMFYL
jgi:hypothetical protein